MTLTPNQPGCDVVAQPINMRMPTKEDNMTTMSVIVYVNEKATGEQTMLVVDTDMSYNLEKQWKEATNVDRTTDPLYVVEIAGTRKPMKYMLPIPCDKVQAILVGTTDVTKVKDDTHAMLGYKALADAQVYTEADGVVAMKNGYGAVMEELRWNNIRLPQPRQHEYVRRPSPGGNTLTQGTKARIADIYVALTKRQNTVLEMSRLMNEVPTAIDTQVMDDEGRQTWVDPVDGHVITVEEYLDGIASRVAPQHHNDMTGRPSVYQVDECWMKVNVDGDHIVPTGDEHYMYQAPKHPALTTLGLGYLVMPAEAGRNVIHQFGVTATIPLDAQGPGALAMYKAVRQQLCTMLIPRMGRSCMRDTPSRAGYHSHHVKQADGTYRNVPVTCPETRLDGTICGGHYKNDSRGYLVCQECGVEYEMTEEEQSEELKHKLHDSNADYTPDSVTNDYDLEDHLASLDAEADYAGTSYTQDTDAPVITAATVARTHKLGGAELDGKMGAMAKRLDRNIAAWRTDVDKVPADEQRAKDRAHEKATRDAECKKANAAAKRAKRVDAQRDLYEHKWRNARKAYAMYALRALIASGITNTTEMLNHLPPHCAPCAYGDYRRELVETGKITITAVGRQREMAVVPVERPVRAQYPAKYDGRKYGNLEYKRGTIMADSGLYTNALNKMVLGTAGTCPAWNTKADHVTCPLTGETRRRCGDQYPPVELPLYSVYNGHNTNSDNMGEDCMYRSGDECRPTRLDGKDVTAKQKAARLAEIAAWDVAYTRKLVYELMYELAMITKGQ